MYRGRRRGYFNWHNDDNSGGPSGSGSGSSSTNSFEGSSYSSSHHSRGRRDFRGGGGGRHPHGLKGRDIGMWYANRSKKHTKRNALNQRQMIQIDQHTEEKIKKLLNLLRHQRENEDTTSSNIPNRSVFKYRMKELDRNEQIDSILMEELKTKDRNRDYQSMLQFRQKLPSFKMREDVLKLVLENQVVVISGETGCGKTTQVPQFILDEAVEKGRGSLCRIVCTQPRRISAISVAERVACERAEPLGNSVGYKIRLEEKVPRTSGSILYCTTGVVVEWLKSDSKLRGVSHIVVDEIHERDIVSDFLLILLRDILPLRPDLKVILMSATLNAEQFSRYFGDCPHVNIPGFTFPVTEYLLEDVYEMLKYQLPREMVAQPKQIKWRKLSPEQKEEKETELKEREDYLNSLKGRYSRETVSNVTNVNEDAIDVKLIVQLIKHVTRNEKDGAILVFLPGWEDIRKVNDLLLKEVGSGGVLVIPLHSLMPTVNQRQVFDRPPPGIRKIVLATNIAETSITIDDVVYVIDCGKIKLKNFDKSINVQTLQAEPVSRANSRQRRGRAGRVQPGICYHLYTGFTDSRMQEYQLPELLRTRLEELCLKIKVLGLGHISTFLSKAMEQPDPDAVDLSINLLRRIDALDETEELTPLGHHLASLPMDPQTGKMILMGAMFSCLDPILTVAVGLSYKDAFVIPLGHEQEVDRVRMEFAGESKSDHVANLRAFQGWEEEAGDKWGYCRRNYLSHHVLRMLADMKRQLAHDLFELGFIPSKDPKHPSVNLNSHDEKLIKAIVAAGLYPNVAQLKNIKNRNPNRAKIARTSEHNRVVLHKKSVNEKEGHFESPFLVYHLKLKLFKNITLFDTTMVPAFPLIFFGGRVTYSEEEGTPTLCVDDWIKFHCTADTCVLVRLLRIELSRLLSKKVRNPGLIALTEGTDRVLMDTVVELISSEEIFDYQTMMQMTEHDEFLEDEEETF